MSNVEKIVGGIAIVMVLGALFALVVINALIVLFDAVTPTV